jgi:cation-transporting ATPase E
VRDNAFMSINVIIFVTGIALLVMGLISDAIVTVSLVTMNVAIAVIQEVRAKRALDRIALLSRLQATIVREGAARRVDPSEIVLGDLLVAEAGDQVMVDGRIVEDGHVALDESLLTGESDAVSRTVGDTVYSGSFVVTGRMVYEAERVGFDSRANQLTGQARVFRAMRTPVQREIDLVLRVMVVLILVLGGPIVLDLVIRLLGLITNAVNGPFANELERAYHGYPVQESVRAMAIVVGLVPQGIALMLTVTYAMGAVRLAGRGALLQQANAIESLSHVDVICFDKTGTLTTNRLAYHDTHALDGSEGALRAALGDYATNATSRNRTIEALAAALPGRSRPVREEIPFSSARKWSAIALGDGPGGTLVLGAPEVLLPALERSADAEAQVSAWTAEGLRVILLARAGDGMRWGTDGEPRLPARLEPLGLVSFHDELQPDAAAIFDRFGRAGVAVKIISGDHPDTVAALTRQAGLGDHQELDVVSGLDLPTMRDGAFADAVEMGEIFGRITPEQKLEIVRQLQRRGHYVAMIGDGVNDVLALKQAEVGIAMEQGSQATRAVSDLVLLGGAFGVLPAAFQEGRRIVRSLQDLLKLFLIRSLSVTATILGAVIIGAAFPVIPTQNVLPAVFTIGAPAFLLALWTRAGEAPGGLMRNVLPFIIPASLTIGVVETTVYIAYLRTTNDVELARTMLTVVAILCGMLTVLYVRPPSPRWEAGAPLAGDWRVMALVVTQAAVVVLVFLSEGLRSFFDLSPLNPGDVVIAVALAAAWAWAIRESWRRRLMYRLLGLEGEGAAT